MDRRNGIGYIQEKLSLARFHRAVSAALLALSFPPRNGEILGLSGPRNPYPGKIGVVEKDALADVLDRDPVADIADLEKPEMRLALIMNGGNLQESDRVTG